MGYVILLSVLLMVALAARYGSDSRPDELPRSRYGGPTYR